MYDIPITLVKETLSVTAEGDTISTITEREVFCTVKSIGMSEHYKALVAGVQPELKFELSDHLDYEGERLIRYDGKVYQVLRSYRVPEIEKIELVVSGDGSTQ